MHAAMAPGSLLLDPDDPTAFTLSYMAIAHEMRPDIIPLLYFRTRWGYEQMKRRHPELLPKWEIQSGQTLLGILVSRGLQAGRDIYVDLPQKTPIGTVNYPAGLLYKILEKPPEIDERLSLYYRAERARHVIRFRDASLEAGFFTRHTLEYWSSSLNNLGIEAHRNGWPDKAVELYRRALLVSPHLAEAWNNMGNAVLEKGDADAAEGCYRMSLRLKPKAEILYNLGRVFLLKSRYVDAEREFRRSIDAGGPRESRNDLGLVFLRTGRLEEASRIWLGLLDEDPYYLLAYYNLGLVYEKMGRNEDAFRAVSAYAQLVADPREKRAARAWLARLKK